MRLLVSYIGSGRQQETLRIFTKRYSVCAVQMVCDVLDLHEMMETMRRESKRLSCQILKDKEKVGYPLHTP